MENAHPGTEPFEPAIAGFFCHTCCGNGEDREPVVRDHLPANLTSLKYVCASMVGPHHIKEALDTGVDGVLICGCLVGNCQNSSENRDVLRSIHNATMTLQDLGIPADRIRREWVCIPGGETYEGALADFVEFIRELGPLEPRAKSALSQQA
jgi:F420-non-reducing hydrogenase iron-sulfur subunit